jgi:hypothetical protein
MCQNFRKKVDREILSGEKNILRKTLLTELSFCLPTVPAEVFINLLITLTDLNSTQVIHFIFEFGCKTPAGTAWLQDNYTT